MSLPLLLASLWVLVAALSAALPSKRNHWPAAYALIIAAIPILYLIARQHGPWVALASLLAATSILRWPLIYLIKWIKRLGTR